jgi:hypothetical protein
MTERERLALQVIGSWSVLCLSSLSTPKVKEFIPSPIRSFISCVCYGVALYTAFLALRDLASKDGSRTVLLWVAGGVAVMLGIALGIAFIANKVYASRGKKSTDDAIDP